MPEARAFDAVALLAVLERHGVDYVLIGGFAATVHGSPLLTRDVDVTPSREVPSLERLAAALTELDSRVRVAGEPDGLPFSHDATSLAAATTWDLTTRYGDLDIAFTPSGTRGYHDLLRDSRPTDIGGLRVRVASLMDVVRSKEAAGRPKDRRSLPILREILERTQPDERPPP